MSSWLIALILGAVVTVGTVVAARKQIVPPRFPWWAFLSTVSLALALYSGNPVTWLIFWVIVIGLAIFTLFTRPAIAAFAVVFAAILVLLSGVIARPLPALFSGSATEVVAETPESTEPSATAECPAEFVQVAVDRSSGNKVDPRFEELTRSIWDDATSGAIDNATTKSRLIEQVKFMAGSNAQSLAAWAFDNAIWDDANNWQPLVDGGSIVDGGCLSPEGQSLWSTYVTMMENSDVQAGTVPAWFVGAGITGDAFNYAFASGINSDPSSFVWTKPSGEKNYQQVICGNTPRETEKPGIPKGPTEGQEEPPPPPETTPPTVTEMCPWNPSLPKGDPNCVKPAPKKINEAPQNTGNLPEPQKPNPLPANPGHAQPTTPAAPPPTYTAPTPLPPAPPAPAPNNPTPVPTKDPAPPPAPEPEAPVSSAPETGCIVIPGVEPCKP